MVIAVTHDNGNVGQHFGHAEEFKLYEIMDGKIMDSAVVKNYEGGGHELTSMLMEDYNVSVVICQNIGDGAQAALNNIGVQIVPNIEGACDDAIEAYLSGSLIVSAEDAGCASCSGGSCCGSDAGGCGGCC